MKKKELLVIQQLRDEIQNNAVQTIIQHNYKNVFLEISPRVGKTNTIFKAIKDKGDRKIYILVPRIPVKKSWEKESIKWNFPYKLNVLCFKSIDKIPKDVDLIIVDECHMLSNNDFYKLKNYKDVFKTRLILISGTMNGETKYKLKNILGVNQCFKYDVENAIKDNIVAGFKVLVLKIPLDNKDAYIKTELGEYTEQGIYDYFETLTEEIKKKEKLNKFDYKRLESISRIRSNFIYTSISKIKILKKLSLILKNKRKVILCYRNNIADAISNLSYHNDNVKLNNLEKFINNTRLKTLAAVGKISVGITIPNLKHILIQQINSNSEMTIQKIMRACNFENGKEGKIIILCYKNTRDENWVRSGLKEIDKKRITYMDCDLDISLEQLKEKINEFI